MIRQITNAYRKITLALLLLSFLGAGYSAYAECLHLIPYSTWAEDDSEYEAGFRLAFLERCTFQGGVPTPDGDLGGYDRLRADPDPPPLPETHPPLHELQLGHITALDLRRGPPEFLPPGL